MILCPLCKIGEIIKHGTIGFIHWSCDYCGLMFDRDPWHFRVEEKKECNECEGDGEIEFWDEYHKRLTPAQCEKCEGKGTIDE